MKITDINYINESLELKPQNCTVCYLSSGPRRMLDIKEKFKYSNCLLLMQRYSCQRGFESQKLEWRLLSSKLFLCLRGQVNKGTCTVELLQKINKTNFFKNSFNSNQCTLPVNSYIKYTIIFLKSYILLTSAYIIIKMVFSSHFILCMQ